MLIRLFVGVAAWMVLFFAVHVATGVSPKETLTVLVVAPVVVGARIACQIRDDCPENW